MNKTVKTGINKALSVSLIITCAHLGVAGIGLSWFPTTCEANDQCQDVCVFEEFPHQCYPKYVPGFLVSTTTTNAGVSTTFVGQA